MKPHYWLFFVAIGIVSFSRINVGVVGPSKKEIQQYAATETYPSDTYLDTVINKRALIIVAHDDDDCMMAGTIAKLKKQGWEIEEWALYTTPLAKDRTTHPSIIICNGNKAIVEDNHYRNVNPRDSTLAVSMPIPRDQFASIFETEKVSTALVQKINAYNPSVIFTLDNEMGAYGHPDHVFISQLVLDLFQEKQIHIQRIYQGVYTNHMEKEIIEIRLTKLLDKWGYENTYLVAKKVYGVEGMPEPNVQLNIQVAATEKMEYLRAYDEKAKKNLRKFIPYYEEFDAESYFAVFDREFYRVFEH